ncbi:hypothetical protein ACQ4PT_008583 [Festuca glaucescens]
MSTPLLLQSPSLERVQLSPQGSDLDGSPTSPPDFQRPRSYAEAAATPPPAAPLVCADAPAHTLHALERSVDRVPQARPSVHSRLKFTAGRPAPQVTQEWQLVCRRDGRHNGRSFNPAERVNAAQRSTSRINGGLSYLEEHRGRCFRCLQLDHRVAFCPNPTRCIHCLFFGHIARHCGRRHLPRTPLSYLDSGAPPAAIHPPSQPLRDRLVFPSSSTPPAAACSPPLSQSSTLPPPPPHPACPLPVLAPPVPSVVMAPNFPSFIPPLAPPNAPGSALRRVARSTCVIELTQEMVDEEARLREIALVVLVAGVRAPLVPDNVAEGLRTDFPELPGDAFQVSLMHPEAFFVRFSNRSWCDLVARAPLFRFRGVPLIIRRYTRLCFTEMFRPRYSVRLFIEGLPPQAWSTSTVKKMLPECHIFCTAKETDEKTDISYFVADAWVEHPDLVPREVDFSIHEPWADANQLHGLLLPPGFISAHGQDDLPDEWMPRRPRLLRKIVLVHIDSTTYAPPVPPSQREHPNRSNENEDDEPPSDRWRHPWGRGVSDDAWHKANGDYVGNISNNATGRVPPRHGSRGSHGSRRLVLADAHMPPHADFQAGTTAPPPPPPTSGDRGPASSPNGTMTEDHGATSPLEHAVLPLTGAPVGLTGVGAPPVDGAVHADPSPNRGAVPPGVPLGEADVLLPLCPFQERVGDRTTGSPLSPATNNVDPGSALTRATAESAHGLDVLGPLPS